MATLHGFAPVANRDAEVLILGSMPGVASLAAGQYYAHTHNAFWRILAELLQFRAYADKLRALKSARIALWDVLQACSRPGSLDAMIERDSETANDIGTFLRTHRKIQRVLFNGAKAESCFKRHVAPGLEGLAVLTMRLPSTSPAHAGMAYARKLELWRAALSLPCASSKCIANSSVLP